MTTNEATEIVRPSAPHLHSSELVLFDSACVGCIAKLSNPSPKQWERLENWRNPPVDAIWGKAKGGAA